MFKRFSRLAGTLLAAWLCLGALNARAATVTDKPRLAILLSGAPGAFANSLQSRLSASHRFALVDRPSLKGKLASGHLTLGDRWTVRQCEEAYNLAGADWVLDGSVSQSGGGVRVTSRLYNLRTGEFSRELSLMGNASDAKTLAGELADFVRESAPLHCLISAVQDDQLIVDLGAMDGVTVGSLYKLYRDPQNAEPVYIGTVRITAASPLGAVGEMQDTVDGYTPRRGDALVEETAGLLVGQH